MVIHESEPGQRESLLRLSPFLPASSGRFAGAPRPKQGPAMNRWASTVRFSSILLLEA